MKSCVGEERLLGKGSHDESSKSSFSRKTRNAAAQGKKSATEKLRATGGGSPYLQISSTLDLHDSENFSLWPAHPTLNN